MLTSTYLLRQRRFLPLFATQLLNAFNDNLFKNAMVLFVVYNVYNSEEAEGKFSAVASGLFILPFFLLSAMSGQLADMRDKSLIIRWVKLAEIGIMTIEAAGLACKRVNKVREGRPHIVDMIKNDEIALIVNTTEGRQATRDSMAIRREAVSRRVTYFTTLAAGLATCEALDHIENQDVNRLQDLHRELNA